MWVKLAEIEPAYTGRAVVVETDPTRERENERPWDEAKRRHWFWSEVWKVRREFWPVLLAALIVNLLAFAMPLFTMNVYDRVIPNKAVATLWVLALGVLLALAFDFTLRVARARLIDEVGRKLDAKLSQKLFEKVMNLPMADRQGSTGALRAARLRLRVGARLLRLDDRRPCGRPHLHDPVPGVHHARRRLARAGSARRHRDHAHRRAQPAAAMGRVALDAQADSSLQHSVLVESISRRGDAQGRARRRADARPLAALFGDERRDQRADAQAYRSRRQPRQHFAADRSASACWSAASTGSRKARCRWARSSRSS